MDQNQTFCGLLFLLPFSFFPSFFHIVFPLIPFNFFMFFIFSFFFPSCISLLFFSGGWDISHPLMNTQETWGLHQSRPNWTLQSLASWVFWNISVATFFSSQASLCHQTLCKLRWITFVYGCCSWWCDRTFQRAQAGASEKFDGYSVASFFHLSPAPLCLHTLFGSLRILVCCSWCDETVKLASADASEYPEEMQIVFELSFFRPECKLVWPWSSSRELIAELS